MKIKELIEKLQNFNPENNIWMIPTTSHIKTKDGEKKIYEVDEISIIDDEITLT